MKKKNTSDHPNFLTCPGALELPERTESSSSVRPTKIKSVKKEKKSSIKNSSVPLESNGHSKKKTHWLRWSILFFVFVILVVTAPAVFAVTRAGLLAREVQQEADALVEQMKDKDVDGAIDSVRDIRGNLGTIHDSIRGIGFWRNMPYIGIQLRAIEDASAAGVEVTDGAELVLGIVSDIAEVFDLSQNALSAVSIPVDEHRRFEDITPEEKRLILARLHRALPELKSAQAKIDIALTAWNRIPQDKLFAPLRSAFAPVAEQLPAMKHSIDEAVPLMEVLIPLAGYPEPSRYLVLLQNSDELRATGGFIGTVGTLAVDGGEIAEFDFQDIYAIDNPASGSWDEVPPEPIQTYLGVPVWYLRDANWSPDFSVSAERVLDVYRREVYAGTGSYPQDLNGVIAINPPLFTRLLQIVGPIEIDGLVFEPETYFDLLEYEVEVGFLEKGIPRDQRKELLSQLGDVLLSRLMSLPVSQWSEVLDIFTNALDQKQVMVYTKDPELLERLGVFGWTGRTPDASGDFLWVIDSNLAALKTDAVVDKNVNYSVDASDPNNVLATVTLTYRNNATGYGGPHSDQINYKYTRYRSYTRVYVPEGSEFISSSGAMKNDRYLTGGRFVPGVVDVYRELGKTVFGAFWSIEPNSDQSLSFTYKLPEQIASQIRNGSYRLDWPKQSGNDQMGMAVDILFSRDVQHANPAEESSEWGDRRYVVETYSLVDRRFEVELK